MSDVAERVDTILEIEPDDEESVVHRICCINEYVALCGRILAAESQYATPGLDDACPKCEKLELTVYCPLLGRCEGSS